MYLEQHALIACRDIYEDYTWDEVITKAGSIQMAWQIGERAKNGGSNMTQQEVEALQPGTILRHMLGHKVMLIKKVFTIRGCGENTTVSTTLKCRCLDANGIFHVQEFYLWEIEGGGER